MTNELQQHLAEKVAGLAPDARRAVYEKAREALQSDVRAAAPFMPVQTVVARRRELENAIIAVEKEAARSDPPRSMMPKPAAVPPPPPPPPVEPPPAALPEAPVAEHQVDPAPETTSIAPEPDSDVARVQAETLAALMEKPLARTASRSTSGQAQGPYAHLIADAAEAENETVIDEEIGDLIAAQKRRRSTVIYLGVAALVLCAAALAVILMSFAFEPAKERAAQATRPPAPAVIPRPATPESKLIDGAGFRSAALQALKDGNALLARRDYTRAIAAFDDALRFDPDNAEALGNRALAHWTTGNAQAAIRDYGAAIDRDPKNADLRFNRAVALNKTGEYRRAVEDLDRAIAANPENANALNSRCWARAMLSHLDEALADCNEAVKRRPQDAEAYDSRGFVFLRLGRLDRAIGDYNEALKLQPKHAGALYGRGLAKIGRGDRAGGQDDVAAARAIDPEIVATFARYGVR